jgi:hypothetical protein
MIRTLTLREFMLEELNRQLAEDGRDVRIVAERPKPTLATAYGEVIEMRRREGDTA